MRLAFVVGSTCLLSGCALWLLPQDPKNAQRDPYLVRITALKGFDGDLVYLGSDGADDYFRLGHWFPNYYKTPSCNTAGLGSYPIGSHPPVTARAENVPIDSPRCN